MSEEQTQSLKDIDIEALANNRESVKGEFTNKYKKQLNKNPQLTEIKVTKESIVQFNKELSSKVDKARDEIMQFLVSKDIEGGVIVSVGTYTGNIEKDGSKETVTNLSMNLPTSLVTIMSETISNKAQSFAQNIINHYLKPAYEDGRVKTLICQNPAVAIAMILRLAAESASDDRILV